MEQSAYRDCALIESVGLKCVNALSQLIELEAGKDKSKKELS